MVREASGVDLTRMRKPLILVSEGRVLPAEETAGAKVLGQHAMRS